MKKQLIGGLMAALFIVGLMAPAAMAEIDGVALFPAGTAAVGERFSTTCSKKASAVTGKGLGLPVEGEPPAITHKNAAWRLDTDFTFLGKSQDGPDVYVGHFHACGYLGAPLNLKPVIGATCLSTKGQHGIGQADAVGTAVPTNQMHAKLYNIGWKAALGGTLIITGNYQELRHDKSKKQKYGILYAIVQAQPDDSNPTGCLTNTQTTFDVEGVAELTNYYVDKGKYDPADSGDPTGLGDIFGAKKCAGGPPDTDPNDGQGNCPNPGPQK